MMFRCTEIGSVSNQVGYSRAGKWIVQSVDPCILIVMLRSCISARSGFAKHVPLGSCKKFCVFLVSTLLQMLVYNLFCGVISVVQGGTFISNLGW